MRTLFRCILAGLMLAAAGAAPAAQAAPAAVAPLDTTADHVLGQPGFTTGDANHGGIGLGLNGPQGVTVDAHTGRLYVADNGNNRVLSWPNAQAFSNGQAADLVLGQPNLSSNDVNHGGLSAASLFSPSGVATDSDGNLFVADTWNNRVLEYTTPFTTHADANVVLGQPNFITNTSYLTATYNTLEHPQGLALDAVGVLWVADTDNNRVLGFTALSNGGSAIYFTGQLSYFGNAPNADGLNDHGLSGPQAVAVDGLGGLLVADTGNNRVLYFNHPRAIPGSVSANRVFGQPSFLTNTVNTGTPGAGTLSGPGGVAVDGAGDVFVADTNNHRALGYLSANISTFNSADRVFGQPNPTSITVNAGGSASDHSFNYPSAAGVDALGNLYVTDLNNNRLLKFDTPVAPGTPHITSLSPASVALGTGNFQLTVNGSNFVGSSVVRLNNSDRPTVFLNSAQLLATVPAADVTSGGPFVIRVFTPQLNGQGGGLSFPTDLVAYTRHSQDSTADEVFGQPDFAGSDYDNAQLEGGANRLDDPYALTVDRRTGRLFVADYYNHRVISWPNAAARANGQAADLVIGQPTRLVTSSDAPPINARTLSNPDGVAVDGQGNLYVADSNNRVLEYSAPLTTGMAAHLVFGQAGDFTSFDANKNGISADSLSGVNGLAVDAQGNLYAADYGNNRVLEYNTPLTTDTTADRVFGQPTFITATTFLVASAATLMNPYDVAVDGSGRLIVADFGDNRVLVYNAPLTTDAAADLVIGQPNFISATANTGGLNASGLNGPTNLAADAAGNLYVADNGNYRVLEYDAPLATHPAAARVFGQPDLHSNDPNNGGTSADSLGNISGLGLDAAGNLFVLDNGNERVLEYDRPLPLLRLFLPLVQR